MIRWLDFGWICPWPLTFKAISIELLCGRIKPARDAAAGESRDEKTGPRPLRGVSALDDVTQRGRRTRLVLASCLNYANGFRGCVLLARGYRPWYSRKKRCSFSLFSVKNAKIVQLTLIVSLTLILTQFPEQIDQINWSGILSNGTSFSKNLVQ